MAQLVALMSGVVLGGVAEVVGSNLARGKIFTSSISSVDLQYPSVFIYCVNLHQFLILCSSKAMMFVQGRVVGSRKGQILQARLSLECKSFNSDFYQKHIVPSPSCQCGEFESAAHFLFNCPIYTNERQRHLPNNLRTFTTKDLLFGCENASEQDNQSLFLQVQDLIVNSGRFPYLCPA